jgi:hypothetical protein
MPGLDAVGQCLADRPEWGTLALLAVAMGLAGLASIRWAYRRFVAEAEAGVIPAGRLSLRLFPPMAYGAMLAFACLALVAAGIAIFAYCGVAP